MAVPAAAAPLAAAAAEAVARAGTPEATEDDEAILARFRAAAHRWCGDEDAPGAASGGGGPEGGGEDADRARWAFAAVHAVTELGVLCTALERIERLLEEYARSRDGDPRRARARRALDVLLDTACSAASISCEETERMLVLASARGADGAAEWEDDEFVSGWRVRAVEGLAAAVRRSARAGVPKEFFVLGGAGAGAGAGGLLCGTGGRNSWWPFGDGFCVALWVNLCHGAGPAPGGDSAAPADEYPTVFSFLTTSGHGVEAFFHDRWMVIDERTEARQAAAGTGSRAHFGFTFEPARWYSIVVEYEPRRGRPEGARGGTGAGSNLGGDSASAMRLWVDGELVESRPFELMKISNPLSFCCVATSPPGIQRAPAAGGAGGAPARRRRRRRAGDRARSWASWGRCTYSTRC